jgi:hypothetical protein
MWKKTITKLIAIVVLWLICIDTTAQGFLGLSVNYGDKLTFTPNYPNVLLQRRSFSPTLVYANQKRFHSDFALLFGGQAGIAGYQLIPELGDTLSAYVEHYPFTDYGIFVSRLEITPGKVFHIGKREFFIGLGGGISYYLVFPFTTMSVSVVYKGADVSVFSSYVESSSSGVFSEFAKVYMKMPVSDRIEFAFQYSSHFKSILEGEFEFYHTKTPSSGTIKLFPQGVSLMFLYRLKDRSD